MRKTKSDPPPDPLGGELRLMTREYFAYRDF